MTRGCIGLFGLLVALCAGSAHAMTLEEYRQRHDEAGIRYYVAGVGAGYFYTNLYLDEIGRAKLYCQPRSVTITGPQYGALLDDYSARADRRAGGISVEVLLLTALVQKFPCR